MAFDHIPFPLLIERATSSLEFSTTIIPTGSGAEQRIGNWLDARVLFNAGMGVRSKQDITTLVKFFRARKGRLRGFLVKDLLDYAATGDPIGIGNGTNKIFQLARVYTDTTANTVLPYGITGNTDTRPIYKPISGTISIYKGVTLQTQGGFGGYATATITAGVITAINLVGIGSGYTSAPTVTITGTGTGAVVTATVSGGAITGFTISNGGTGYTNATVTIVSTNGDYNLDYKTGLLTFIVAPTNGTIVSWTGEFYVPCRFVEDTLPADEIFYDVVESRAAGNVPDVMVVETRDFL